MLKFECRRSEKGCWAIATKRAQFLGCSADRQQTSLELGTPSTVDKMFLLWEGG